MPDRGAPDTLPCGLSCEEGRKVIAGAGFRALAAEAFHDPKSRGVFGKLPAKGSLHLRYLANSLTLRCFCTTMLWQAQILLNRKWSDSMSYTSQDGGSNIARYILLGAAVVYVAVSIFFMVQAQNRLTDLENRQKIVQQEIAKKVDDANGQTRASIEVIADKVGITQKDLAKKASVLQAEEAATQQRLKADEEATKTQFTAVNGAVDGVKGQVNKVSADVSD